MMKTRALLLAITIASASAFAADPAKGPRRYLTPRATGAGNM